MHAGHESPAVDMDVRDALKLGLRRLARSVAVISCSDEHQKYAMTATAVSELSLDPPSMLVCINRAASIHRPLEAGQMFCINVLSRSQQEISALCGGKARGAERFNHEDWRSSEDGIPFLANADAVFQCRPRQRLMFGTHEVFIGEVVGVLTSPNPDPLLYVGGSYASVGQPLAAAC